MPDSNENGLRWNTKSPSSIYDTFNTNLIIINRSTPDVIVLKHVVVDNFNESPSQPEFSGVDIPGRSSPPQAYTGGSTRTISFNVQLHRDIVSAGSEFLASLEFSKLLNRLKAFNYPNYSPSGVIPPKATIILNQDITCVGYLSTTFDYKRPIDRYGRYMIVDVHFSMHEVLDISKSANQVRSGVLGVLFDAVSSGSLSGIAGELGFR